MLLGGQNAQPVGHCLWQRQQPWSLQRVPLLLLASTACAAMHQSMEDQGCSGRWFMCLVSRGQAAVYLGGMVQRLSTQF